MDDCRASKFRHEGGAYVELRASSRRMSCILAVSVWIALPGCAAAGARDDDENERCEVASLLAEFHHRAATADFDGYFALLDENAVFLGTDATERWPVPEFREFAQPHFDKPAAWVFVPEKQNITVSDDARFAWFDELLRSESYGLCRGSGVANRTAAGWKLCQYNLTVPIPNDLLGEVVALVRSRAVQPAR